MDVMLINVVSLMLSAFTLGLLSAQCFDSYYEKKRRKRLKADEEKRRRVTSVDSRLYKIELQQTMLGSRLDRIETSKNKAW